MYIFISIYIISILYILIFYYHMSLLICIYCGLKTGNVAVIKHILAAA